jgi:hypothetical protein
MRRNGFVGQNQMVVRSANTRTTPNMSVEQSLRALEHERRKLPTVRGRYNPYCQKYTHLRSPID